MKLMPNIFFIPFYSILFFSDSFSEIMKTGKNPDSNKALCDGLNSSASPQQVRGKEPRSNFSDELTNYKFALIRYKPLDDSSEMRNLFHRAEGGKTRVPTHLLYEVCDDLSLSFSVPDSIGQPRKLPHDKFHASAMSPVGYDLQSLLRAIRRLRLLRNLSCNSLIKAEIDKEVFDHFVQQAKEACITLGIATAQIDAIASTPLDSPLPVPWEVEDGIRQEILVDGKCLEGFPQKLKQKTEDLQQEHGKRSKADTCVYLSFYFSVGKKKIRFPGLSRRLSI